MLLVLNGDDMGSTAALVHGFMRFSRHLRIAGALLTRVSSRSILPLPRDACGSGSCRRISSTCHFFRNASLQNGTSASSQVRQPPIISYLDTLSRRLKERHWT